MIWYFTIVSDDEKQSVTCPLTLTNTSSSRLAFKVKTTHRNRYLVRPNQALLNIDASAEIDGKS